MLIFLSFGIALLILLLAVVFAIKNRSEMSKWISCVLIGIFFATFFMVLPTEWLKSGKEVFNKPLYSFLSSLLYSLKCLGGRQDISQIESTSLSGVYRAIYIIINYINFTLAPILTSSLIISFVGNSGEKIRYFFSGFSKHYVFSEINENSIELAKGIKQTPGRKTLIFCNTKNANKDLLEEAKKLGGITLYISCKNLKLWFKNYEFYFINENEDDNIELTQEIITKKEKFKNRKITVNAFAQSGINIEVVESMISKKPCAVFDGIDPLLIDSAITVINTAPNTKLVFFGVLETDEKFNTFLTQYTNELNKCNYETHTTSFEQTELDDYFKNYDITLHYLKEETNNGKTKTVLAKKGLGYYKKHLVSEWQDEPLKIRFIDEIALFCNNLIFEYPIYNLPDNRKDISILLVGCGRLGTQMLKTTAWCGQIEGYTLKIRVLDKNASSIEKEFYSQYPEMNNYDIKFENVDIKSTEFEEKIKSCSDATFVCVATGSDELNIATAESIYCILKRNFTGFTPPIYTRIRKMLKTKNFEEKGSFLADRNIHLFGTTDSIFSNNTLFNSELESLAFAVHLCYNWAIDMSKDSFEYKKALNDFYSSEYSRRSSMAAALHIPAKIKSLGVITKDTLPSSAELSNFEELIKRESLKQTLMINEHERWNAFMRSEGFRTVDFETVKKYAPYTRSHKDESAKLHPCILSWDKLDILQKQYNELQNKLNLKKSDFKEYDEKLVVEIPKIIKRANELTKEGW